jgi:endonuclease I
LTGLQKPSIYQMGDLQTLLLWHIQDPVDDFERNRNEVIFGYQGNRNPFIDHPELVSKIYN